MVSAINSALAGLQAAGNKLEVSAAKIAGLGQNLGTPKVDGKAQSQAPQKTDKVTLSEAATNLSQASGLDGQGTDLGEEVVNQTIASYDFKANLKSLQVQNNITQSLIDIIS